MTMLLLIAFAFVGPTDPPPTNRGTSTQFYTRKQIEQMQLREEQELEKERIELENYNTTAPPQQTKQVPYYLVYSGIGLVCGLTLLGILIGVRSKRLERKRLKEEELTIFQRHKSMQRPHYYQDLLDRLDQDSFSSNSTRKCTPSTEDEITTATQIYSLYNGQYIQDGVFEYDPRQQSTLSLDDFTVTNTTIGDHLYSNSQHKTWDETDEEDSFFSINTDDLLKYLERCRRKQF